MSVCRNNTVGVITARGTKRTRKIAAGSYNSRRVYMSVCVYKIIYYGDKAIIICSSSGRIVKVNNSNKYRLFLNIFSYFDLCKNYFNICLPGFFFFITENLRKTIYYTTSIHTYINGFTRLMLCVCRILPNKTS